MTTRTYTEVPCVYCGQTGWHACNLGVDTTTSVLPVPAPEQQGEPVCARCGLPGDIYDHSTGYKYHHTYHDFEPPTPPPSEEAEARPLRPARNVTAWTDESYRELEEERDRLREERDAARRSDMRSTAAAVEQLHRAEAAEAQVAELRSYHAGCDERFDAYERRHAQDQAQVQELRAAREAQSFSTRTALRAELVEQALAENAKLRAALYLAASMLVAGAFATDQAYPDDPEPVVQDDMRAFARWAFAGAVGEAPVSQEALDHMEEFRAVLADYDQGRALAAHQEEGETA